MLMSLSLRKIVCKPSFAQESSAGSLSYNALAEFAPVFRDL